MRWGLPFFGALTALALVTAGPGTLEAAIVTSTTVTTPSGTEQFSVANVPPRIWVAKGLNQLPGDVGAGESTALEANTAYPDNYYNFEILVADDNTLWNSRIVICFHNTSHPVGYSGGSFSGTSNFPLFAYNDCVRGGNALDVGVDYSSDAGVNAANPAGASADSSSVSQGESWRKARWVLKQKSDPDLPYGVDPTASEIVNDTTNNGTWRLGPARATDPTTSANAPCAHATRTVGGVARKTRYDSTLVHLKCSVRIGALARASAPGAADDWDLFVAVIDSGEATSETIVDASALNQNVHQNQVAFCSGLPSQFFDGLGPIYGYEHLVGVDGYGYEDSYRFPGYDSCATDGYAPPSMFRVATSLSIGSVEGHDFGTLVPPTQQLGPTRQDQATDLVTSSGTDPNPVVPTPAETTDRCAHVSASPTPNNASWFTCVHAAHTVGNLVANTDHWKFQSKTSAPDGVAECNTIGNAKIAPALGYSSGMSYTCWYATTNPVDNVLNDDTLRNANQTYAVALYEPGTTEAEWSDETMAANQFAFRCMAYPRDALEAGTVTRYVDVPSQAAARTTAPDATVYVGKAFADVPLFEYGTGTNHVVDQEAGGANVPATSVAAFDGMGSDNTSGDTTRIWRRLEGGFTSYSAYLHCRIDTSYVRPGTYTGIVYLAITTA